MGTSDPHFEAPFYWFTNYIRFMTHKKTIPNKSLKGL